MNCIFRPAGKKAPPRPRRLAVFSSSMIAAGARPRARPGRGYPPTAGYSATWVRSRSSAPARTITSLIAQLLEDLRDVGRRDVQPVAIVDRDDGRRAAAADALDPAQRERPMRRGLAGRAPEPGLEGGQHILRPAKPAADVRADLDEPPPDRLQMELVVEGRDALAVPGRPL